MFDLADHWVWDFWTVADGEDQHLFFLKAPRSLGDPDLRHRSASVGHAISTDLRNWDRLADALDPSASPGFDDLATWTGSCLRADDTWWMFTSGLSRAEDGRVQRIGAATSADLVTWERTDLVLEADTSWYAAAATEEVHWRDPFVIKHQASWHMYVTAKTPGVRGNGVIGHATSSNLRDWTVGPPLAGPSGIFDQLEVISLAEVDGRWVLLFSCLAPEVVGAPPGHGGVWSVSVDEPGAPVDLRRAVRLTSEDLYVGRLVLLAGAPYLLAFENRDPEGRFRGGVIDPLAVRWRADAAGIELVPGAAPDRWYPEG